MKTLLSLASFFVAAFIPTHAAIVFNNGPTDGRGSFINDPTLYSPVYMRAGDDFSLTSNTILGGISWSGGYTYGSDPSAPPPLLADERLDFAFFKRDTLAMPVATVLGIPLTRTDLGIGNSHLRFYSYTAALPSLALDAGDYLLMIQAHQHGGLYYWFWATSHTSKDDISYVLTHPNGEWIPYSTEFAFALYDSVPHAAETPTTPEFTPVPEISVFGPAGAGFLVLLVGRRISRRRQQLTLNAKG